MAVCHVIQPLSRSHFFSKFVSITYIFLDISVLHFHIHAIGLDIRRKIYYFGRFEKFLNFENLIF